MIDIYLRSDIDSFKIIKILHLDYDNFFSDVILHFSVRLEEIE